jgi:hypothetical protein
MRFARKTAVVIGVILIGVIAAFSPRLWAARKTLPYDLGYYRVVVGDTDERVKEYLGNPHFAFSPPSGVGGTTRHWVYRVDDGIGFPLKWTIGFDASGKVTFAHRERDAC